MNRKKESVQKESRGGFSDLLSLVLGKTGCRSMLYPALAVLPVFVFRFNCPRVYVALSK